MRPMAKQKLGEILVEEGIITEELLMDFLTRQQHHSGRLGRALVEVGFLREDELLAILSRMLGFPAVDLDSLSTPHHVIGAVHRDVVAQLFFMPIDLAEAPTRILSIAVPDPSKEGILEQIKCSTRCEIKPYVATETALLRALDRYYGLREADLGVGYEGYAMARFTPGERGLWEEERKKMLRSQRIEQLVGTALIELLVEKGYFAREEYMRRLGESEPSEPSA